MNHTFNIAINGYGRIGRCLLRAIFETQKNSLFNIVAINDPSPIKTMCYLTRYDSTHGVSDLNIGYDNQSMQIGDQNISVYHQTNPANINWQQLKIDLLFECSGSFADIKTAQNYLATGADKVLISHPNCTETDATIVFGTNEQKISANSKIVSAASCTTNCIVPIICTLDEQLGISSGSLTTLHSAMNDQPVIDNSNTKNLRLSRSAIQSMIPVDTALAKGIARILPKFTGKFQTNSIRIPTVNVSCIDACFLVDKPTTSEAVNSILQQTSKIKPHLIGVSNEPHASIDFNHDSRSCIVDLTQTKVTNNKLVKLLCWFDNEWGFVNRMLNLAEYWLGLHKL